jgi:eukaryotic-like serine/threonine-protein kinase
MSSELRATLAISKSEALTGTSRTLTLPGGRKVTVNVPAGAYDGQIIRVEDAVSTLLLSLSIMQAEGSAFATGPNSDDLTVAASNPYLQTPSGSIPNPYLQNTPVHAQYPYEPSATPPPPSLYAQNQGQPAFPPASSKGAASRLLSPRNIVLAGLVLLLVVAGVVGAVIFTRNNPAGNTNVAATTTAVARVHITATASFIAANPNPYPPHRGALVLSDSLRPDSSNNGWDRGGACVFRSDGYHASVSSTNFFNDCLNSKTTFGNFTYQVTMKIIKGNAGGIIFRADSVNSKYYLFRVGVEGIYVLSQYVDNVGSHSKILSRSFCLHCNLGLNQTNVLAVVANGHGITLYVNSQQIASINDSSYDRGQIGVIAYPYSDPTEVVYTNAKVWTF